MVGDSWTHKIARICILPLVNSPITPNHLTTIRLITGVAACGLFAIGTTEWNLYGGFLWIVSTFLDRADGELARVGGKTSPWGHKYDYFSDVFAFCFPLCESSTVNSSPPYRATTSVVRTCLRIIFAISLRTLSPIWCP